MVLIRVPRPPDEARNPDRPVSSLLRMQIEHLYQAEQKLPLRYRTEIYVNAIKTEGEAATYIREATEAIRAAHAEAARASLRRKVKRPLEIAAAAERSKRKPSSKPRGKSAKASGSKPRRKK